MNANGHSTAAGCLYTENVRQSVSQSINKKGDTCVNLCTQIGMQDHMVSDLEKIFYVKFSRCQQTVVLFGKFKGADNTGGAPVMRAYTRHIAKQAAVSSCVLNLAPIIAAPRRLMDGPAGAPNASSVPQSATSVGYYGRPSLSRECYCSARTPRSQYICCWCRLHVPLASPMYNGWLCIQLRQPGGAPPASP